MLHSELPPAYDSDDDIAQSRWNCARKRYFVPAMILMAAGVILIIWWAVVVNAPTRQSAAPTAAAPSAAPSVAPGLDNTKQTTDAYRKIINISFTDLYVTHADAHAIMLQRGGIMYEEYSVFTATQVNTDVVKSVNGFMDGCSEPRGHIIRFNLEYFLNSNKMRMTNIITPYFQSNSANSNVQVLIEVEDSELQYEYRTNATTFMVPYMYNELSIIHVHRNHKICQCKSGQTWTSYGCTINDITSGVGNGYYKTVAIFQIKK